MYYATQYYTSSDEPIAVSLASDKHGDKRNAKGEFVNPLTLVYRDALACAKEIYAHERYLLQKTVYQMA
jgi:hypothetical protein